MGKFHSGMPLHKTSRASDHHITQDFLILFSWENFRTFYHSASVGLEFFYMQYPSLEDLMSTN